MKTVFLPEKLSFKTNYMNFSFQSTSFLLLFPLILLTAAGQQGCGGQNSNAETNITAPPSEAPVTGKDTLVVIQDIEDFDIRYNDANPDQVEITISGYYMNGCLKYRSYSITQDQNNLNLTVYSSQPKDAFCTEALVSFTHPITIPVGNLKPGIYTIQSNEISKEFEITE